MRKCDVCGKTPMAGYKYSHSHRKSIKKWQPNIRRVKALINGVPMKINVCAKCLRAGKVKRAI